jgi:uncharacterized protein YhbP (UPF0306 family)
MREMPFRVLPPLDVPSSLALAGFRGILRDAKLLTLAVGTSTDVHVNTAYFAYAPRCERLWFLSEVDTAHAVLVGEGAKGAINIFCPPRAWGAPIRGIQAEVEVRQLPRTSQVAPSAYMSRFPASKKYLSQGLSGDFSNSAYFECRITRAKVIDQALFNDEIYMTLEANPSDGTDA